MITYDFQTCSMDEIFNLDKQYFVNFHYMQFYLKQLVDYQLEVDKGKLTAVANLKS